MSNRSCLFYLPALCMLGACYSHAAMAQPLFSECVGLTVDSERLECFDRTLGADITGTAASETNGPGPAAGGDDRIDRPIIAGPYSTAITATTPGNSLIDTAWAFDPASPHYILTTYQPN
jgi:hypothetical protein